MTENEQKNVKLLLSPKLKVVLIVGCYLILAVYIISMQRKSGTGIMSSSHSLMASNHSKEHIMEWKIAEKSPWSYRALFRWTLFAIASLNSDWQTQQGFFNLYLLLNWFCIGFGACIFYYFLRHMDLSSLQAFMGGILYLSCFPIIFSHEFPINTRGDLMAYVWISATLFFVAKDNFWGVIIFGSLGALTRENTLIAVWPFFFLSKRCLNKKIIAMAIPASMLLVTRYIYGMDSMAMRKDLITVSMNHIFNNSMQTFIYVFMTFGVFWVFALRAFFVKSIVSHKLIKSWLFFMALFLMFFCNVTFAGNLHENRIFFVVFPWVLTLATLYIFSDECKQCFSYPISWVMAILSMVFWGCVLWYVYQTPEFAKTLKQTCGIFEPGFQLEKGPVQFIERGDRYILYYSYSSTPWGAIYLYVHLTVLASYITGFIAYKSRKET